MHGSRGVTDDSSAGPSEAGRMSAKDDRHIDAAVRAAEVRRLAAHEVEVRRVERERGARRMLPTLASEDPDTANGWGAW